MDLTLRLSDDEEFRLHERALADGRSETDVALTAIRHYLDSETREQTIRRLTDEAATRYESTLKRLGE